MRSDPQNFSTEAMIFKNSKTIVFNILRKQLPKKLHEKYTINWR